MARVFLKFDKTGTETLIKDLLCAPNELKIQQVQHLVTISIVGEKEELQSSILEWLKRREEPEDSKEKE
jgi:hypothetical protein